MPLQKYIDDIQRQYKTGIAREHAYRPALKALVEDIMPDITAINDPAHIECGAPDFILHRRKIDVGYIEAKDIGNDLSKTEKDEQLKRYLDSLDNLILTDYLEFRFYLHGEKVDVIRIGEIEHGQIVPLPENYDRLKTLLLDFAAFQGQTIKSAKKLAEMMARKARLMRDVFYKTVTAEDDNSLKDQLTAFQAVLVHDMDAEQFADVYAQTIAYGLFTARLHDPSIETFSRSEALMLIPKSNPFLRQLFHYVAGPDLDDRVIWIVDALCEVYRATDLRAILKDFGTATGQNDPILHFYETFLGEYDNKLKKARGVWYTPEPVVNFIVRAIDDVLKTHFGLKDGIADKSKIEIEVESQEKDKRTKTGRKVEKREVHKVQLLDVATGTGTFLAETVKQIYSRYKGQEGIWSSYVENDLLPRLHGFELLMASYAMCHMKLDLLLQETGYKPSNLNNPKRLSVYLTNSLEEHHPEMDSLFASWLSREANDASWIKKNMPIMVAFGNPPYSMSSSNKGAWIEDLMKEYKKNLQENNINPLSDDYIKFIRSAQHYIDKTGYGIVALITNNSYLDGLIHRQMRKSLLETFDKIYICDLHGSAKKKEIDLKGEKDENVFDIQQGVAISIFVKDNSKTGNMAVVKHIDCFGKRHEKYQFLLKSDLISDRASILETRAPSYYFIPKDFSAHEEYEDGIPLNRLFMEYGPGVQTKRDNLFLDFDENSLSGKIDTLLSGHSDNNFKIKYDVKNSSSYKFLQKIDNCSPFESKKILKYLYRPFDIRKIYYDDKLIGRPSYAIMRNFLKSNIGLILARQTKDKVGCFITDGIIDQKSFSAYDINSVFPLYFYNQDMLGEVHSNLDPKIYAKIKEAVPGITPESLFDYIYVVLYSPAYRERYAEFLKSDFPRIPYPADPDTFHKLAEKGAELRELHLMENLRYEGGKAWINATQYFGGVPSVAWEFYIGGYQPAQKWLKDRKGRNLSIDDIMHYQRIIVALVETDRLMTEIDKIDFLPTSE